MKGLHRVLVLVAISSCVVTIALLAHDAGASTTYCDGAWNITADTTLSNGTWWVNGTVSVTAAKLTLDRAELVIDSTPGCTGLTLDAGSWLTAVDSTIRGATVPLAIAIGGGGYLYKCHLSRLGDASTGLGIRSTGGKLVLQLCTLSDGNRLLMSTSDLVVTQCLFEDFWGFGVEWWSEGSTSVLVEDTTFDSHGPYGYALRLEGPGESDDYTWALVRRCRFVNVSHPVDANRFTDFGALTLEDNVATGCGNGALIHAAGSALIMRGNIWDIEGSAIALAIEMGGEKAPRLTCETLSGQLVVRGYGQRVAISGFLIDSQGKGVVCDGVGLDISDSTIVAEGGDFCAMNGGRITIRRCSHSYTGEGVGEGTEVKELREVSVANVTWQDGSPVEHSAMWFIGGTDLVLGSFTWGGSPKAEVTTWWMTDDFVCLSRTVKALYCQVNVSFLSLPLDPFSTLPLEIVLVDDFTPIVGVLNPLPGVLVGGNAVSVVGDYMEFGAGMGSIEVRFDAGPWALADVTTDNLWNLTMRSLPDGSHTLDVRIMDRAGNSRTLTVTNITTDTSTPVIRVILPPPWVNYGTVRLVARTEAGARAYIGTTEIEVDAFGYFERWYQLTEGSNELRLMAIDSAGNSFAMVYVIVYDSQPPTVVVEQPVDGSWLSSAKVMVSGWTEVTANVTVNGVPAVRAATAFAVELPAEEGTLDVRIVVIDLALNSCTVELRVHVDRTPPVLEVEDRSTDAPETETPVLVSGSVHELGPVTVSVNGIRATSGGDSWSAWLELDEGWNDIAVSATDAAGNHATAVTRILLERPAPTVHATMVVGNAVVKDGKGGVVTGEPTANLMIQLDQRCLLRITGMLPQEAGPGEVVVELDLWGGRNEVVVNVTDLAGRRATVILFVVDRDVVPPAISIKGPDRYSRTDQVSVLIWGVTEPGALVTINGTAVRTGTGGTFSIRAPLREGVNDILVEAEDGFGNVANATITVYRAMPGPPPEGEEGPWRLIASAAIGMAFLLMMLVFVRMMRDARRAPREVPGARKATRTVPRPPLTDAHRAPRVRRRQGP